MPLRLRTTIPPALVAAALAAGVVGCGTEDRPASAALGIPPSDAPPLTRTVSSPAESVRSRPARPADGRSRVLHVPSVLGQTAAAARLRTGAWRFRVEQGRRFVLSMQTSMLAWLVPGEAADRVVTSQLPRRPDVAEPGQVVVLGTEPSAATGRRPFLREAPWTTVRWSAGVLVLDGLELRNSCDRIDHVQIGPRGGPTRFARVWIQSLPVPPAGGCARRTPEAVRLQPGEDWTRDTVAWNGPLSPPRDDLDDVRHVRYRGLTVQPDDRTIMVGVPNGGCEVPAGVSITVRGRIATVDARVGTTPRPEDADPGPRLCTSDLRRSTVMVRLPRELPFGTKFRARG